MKLTVVILSLLLFASIPFAQTGSPLVNAQLHYDLRRDHPTLTGELLAFDDWGYTFSFIDLNFDHYRAKGGISDFYLEIMRYFPVSRWKDKTAYVTLQYDDGSKPISGSVLAGVNIANDPARKVYLSTEFLLRREYQLGITWQYTLVWYIKMADDRLILNGFFDFWNNDIENSNWPAEDQEVASTRYSFQAEPQIGWMMTPRWKVGSEVEISRGFLGSVTGKLANDTNYQHDRWYFLPTIFIQYNL